MVASSTKDAVSNVYKTRGEDKDVGLYRSHNYALGAHTRVCLR